MFTFWNCLFSPRLYKIYREGAIEAVYQPYKIEKWCDRVISMTSSLMRMSIYISPFVAMYMFSNGMYTAEDGHAFLHYGTNIGCFILFCYVTRSIGRSMNPKYVTFMKTFYSNEADKQVLLEALRKYDFDFHYWPISYAVANKVKKCGFLNPVRFTDTANYQLPLFRRVIVQALAYVATHTFGIRLIYPGCLGFIYNLMWPPILQGRTALVEEYNGKRAKILTADDNHIDTMFVDQRVDGINGSILVICCEGNSGFYEVGIMTTPIKSGYSVLGWNHPGFAESTGTPYPAQEQNAIDAVLQYAVEQLNFSPANIVMFGWSIGGYTATWAALHYHTKALVLDASFDDLLPLAQNHMPTSWMTLVREVVRVYVDLNISRFMCMYRGPVRLVRRTDDEIICLRRGVLSSNRGNNLLLNLMQVRHPEIVALHGDEALKALIRIIATLQSQRNILLAQPGNVIDQGTMRLINRYMVDYKSSHCTPLPEDIFERIMASVPQPRRVSESHD